jgi:hypothetical protein
MKTLVKRFIFILSVSFNVLTILLFALVSIGPSPLRFTLGSFSQRYLHSALIVSVPWHDSDPSVVFGPVEITLRKGALAALQLSMIRGNPAEKNSPQTNLAIEPLYDPSVVKIEPTGYGVYVYALDAGETVLQIFSGGSFRDMAHIVVYDPSVPNE